MIRVKEFLDLANCLELTNGDVRLIVSTDVGPRILFYGFDDGENILGWHPEAAVTTELGIWKPYGGHRLWMAPENMPLSYAPDNQAVQYETDGDLAVRLIQQADAAGMQKEMGITLSTNGSVVTIDHRITNAGEGAREISAWALTIMRPGGEAIVPNEPFEPYGSETLLPARSMALWSYTDFTDPRWRFEKKYVRLRVDESLDVPQKFGVLNRQGWAAYQWRHLTFVKRFDVTEAADYPDMNSNTEIYTSGSFVEVETLSPLETLLPGETAAHQERWELNTQ